MLTEQEIQHALAASHVVPLNVSNPHGPFGWELVAHAIADALAFEKNADAIPAKSPPRAD